MTSFPALSFFTEAVICSNVRFTPQATTFWTVYGHLRTGGVEALIDCADEHSAQRAAALLAVALQMLESLKWQDMADADPAVSRRKGYDKRARDLCRKALAAAQ